MQAAVLHHKISRQLSFKSPLQIIIHATKQMTELLNYDSKLRAIGLKFIDNKINKLKIR